MEEYIELDQDVDISESENVDTVETTAEFTMSAMMEAHLAKLQNADLERGLLNELMRKNVNMIDIITGVKPEFFFNMERRGIFETCQEMFNAQMEITPADVKEYIAIKKSAQGVRDMSTELEAIRHVSLGRSVNNANKMLKELYNNRVLKSEVINRAQVMFDSGTPLNEIIEHISKVLMDIETGGKKEMSMSQAGDAMWDKMTTKKGELPGLRTGIDQWDRQFGGVCPDTYYTIGALSGTGKTAFLIDMFARLVEHNTNEPMAILFFSMEMSEERIFKRFVSRMVGMTIQEMDSKVHPPTPEQMAKIKQATETIKKWPIEIVYATMNPYVLKMRMRRFALKNQGKKLLVGVDHIGLIAGETTDMRVNTILASGVLKSFCVDFNASVFNLTQFTKEADAPKNEDNYYRPSMSYIMESGRVRQDSDVVILLWRPEIWFKAGDMEINGDTSFDPKGKMIYLVEKNRDGDAPTSILLDCNIGTNRMSNTIQTFG